MKNQLCRFVALAFVISFFPQPALADTKTLAVSTVSNVTAEKAAALLIAHPEVIIVDVRTPQEFAEGHLSKALNIDVKNETFEGELAKLDKSKTYLVHCRSGARSTRSLKSWKALGFTKIYHLDSGYLGWEKAGLPVVVAE